MQEFAESEPSDEAPKVAVVTLGVGTDVLGLDLDEITEADRAAVVAAHPRLDFKQQILHAFYEAWPSDPARPSEP